MFASSETEFSTDIPQVKLTFIPVKNNAEKKEYSRTNGKTYKGNSNRVHTAVFHQVARAYKSSAPQKRIQ